MKRILLPTDFSENAYNAISYAVQLYKDIKCKFYILHTYTPVSISAGRMVDNYSSFDLQDITKETAERKLKGIEDRLKTEFNNANHTFITMVSFNTLTSLATLSIRLSRLFNLPLADSKSRLAVE